MMQSKNLIDLSQVCLEHKLLYNFEWLEKENYIPCFLSEV